MKTFIITVSAALQLTASSLAGEASVSKSNIFVFPTNHAAPDEYGATNLVSFSSLVPLVDAPRIIATNGLETFLNMSCHSFEYTSNPRRVLVPPICVVSVFNHSTNKMGCLNMPGSCLCRIALLDELGHEVKKTELGKTFGGLLTQEQIDKWRGQWHDRHQSMFIRLVPSRSSKYDDIPTFICSFSINDVFEGKMPGEYELHVQMRLVQIGKDRLGKPHYPVTWLPECVTKVRIVPEKLSK